MFINQIASASPRNDLLLIALVLISSFQNVISFENSHQMLAQEEEVVDMNRRICYKNLGVLNNFFRRLGE